MMQLSRDLPTQGNYFYLWCRQFCFFSETWQDEHRIPEAPGRRLHFPGWAGVTWDPSLSCCAGYYMTWQPCGAAGTRKQLQGGAGWHPAVEKRGAKPHTFTSPGAGPQALSILGLSLLPETSCDPGVMKSDTMA